MNKCSRVISAVAAVLLLAASSELRAQTTGRIFGQAVDAQGAVVPGATVTVTSPSLQGAQTQVTDGDGRFRFLSLPPGRYTLKVELSSFKPFEQKDIDVGLDRTVTIPVTMQLASVTETVTVTGTSPTIDQTSTVTGLNATADVFNKLPVRRDFYGIARIAPGVTEDVVGPVIYGSSSAENQYIIDGLNTTGVELGDKGKMLNNDFVQEVQVMTGGLPAEYGRMTGGVVNVLTKSGSNQFKGSAFAFGEGGFLQSDNSTANLRPQTTTTVIDTAHQADAGFEAGGFIAKDRLWYFGAYNRVNQRDETTIIRTIASPGAPGVGAVVPATINRDLFAVKITGKLGAGHNLQFNVNGDPSKREGNVFNIAGPPSTFSGERETGSADYVGRYNGIFGSRLFVQGIVARHQEKDKFAGAGRDVAQLLDNTVSPVALSGGFGFFQDQEFTRDVYKFDVSHYLKGHDIKGGADLEQVSAVNNNYNGGAGQRIYKFRSSSGVIYYRHRFYVNDRASGFSRTDSSTWRIALPLTSAPKTNNTSFYVQDSWRIGSALTVNAGIRWEGQDVLDRDETTAFKLDKNWSPRVGFVWDVARNNRSKLYASWGRFYESIPMDINIRAFGGELQCFCYNFDPSVSNTIPDATAPSRSSILGTPITPVDPDLRGQYVDEVAGGFEYEVKHSIVVGAKYTRRHLGRAIEDFLIPEEGSYFIANPSKGVGSEMGFYDFEHTAGAPKAERVENAFEVSANKRFSNNWMLFASLVFSKLEGNYDGTFQSSTGQLDPNINSAFDYADFLVNAKGRLSNDRNVAFKLHGVYELSKGPLTGLELALATHWYAGTPLNAYGYSFAYSNWEYYLAPRGSVGRGPSDWEADLRVAYPLRFSGNRRVDLMADIFNLFDRQRITALDQRYNLSSDPHCAGIPDALCNGDGGLVTTGNNLTPAGSLSNPRSTASNPDYLTKGLGFTGQRSIRLGVRFTF